MTKPQWTQCSALERHLNDRLTVLYDEDCGICTHTARVLTVVDTRRLLRLVSLQVAEIPGMPPRERLFEQLHAVDAHGRWFAGGAATVEISRRVPLMWGIGLAAGVPLVARLLDVVYGVIARN